MLKAITIYLLLLLFFEFLGIVAQINYPLLLWWPHSGITVEWGGISYSSMMEWSTKGAPQAIQKTSGNGFFWRNTAYMITTPLGVRSRAVPDFSLSNFSKSTPDMPRLYQQKINKHKVVPRSWWKCVCSLWAASKN